MHLDWNLIGFELLAGAVMCYVTCWLSASVQKPFLSYRWIVLLILLGIFLFTQSVIAFVMAP